MGSGVSSVESSDREIEAFEARIDRLHLNLDLLRYPKNLAFWGFVSNGLLPVYQNQVEQVPERDRTLQSVTSRSFGVFLKKVADCPFKGHVAIKNLRMTPHIRVAASQANEYARFWFAATGYFPEWHRKECTALLTAPNSIRFSLLANDRERQVSAYQKSFRPSKLRIPRDSVYAPIPDWVNEEYARVLKTGITKDDRFLYQIAASVYAYYQEWYHGKMKDAVEHPETTDLGSYDIGDAIRFWSSLASIAAVHDFLCYTVGQRSHVPVNSILMIKKRSEWSEQLARLSGLKEAKCDAILQQITCVPHRVIDLHVSPFMALDEKITWLALATPLAISGRFDQNLLRICSADDPARFNRITPKKEQRLREELSAEAASLQIQCLGPIALPGPLPDIDLIMEDLSDDTLVISEMKWVRQPIGWKSRQRANDELQKGLRQIKDIRLFLNEHPSHLVRANLGIEKPISQYKNVYYALICRGHLISKEAKGPDSTIPFDALKFALKSGQKLGTAMAWLLDDGWLPREGTDFKIQNAHFAHQGYVIQAPVFTPL
jgi:hypothetical protein